MLRQIAPDSDQVIRRTIGAVFRQHVYDRSVTTTLWSRFLDWLLRKLGSAFNVAVESSILHWIVATLAILACLLIIGRAVYVAMSGDEIRRGRSDRTGTHRDPWAEARAFAERGQYSDAAHALYRALLDTFSRRGEVALHPSKTVGDYGRELRRRSLPVAAPYREFARSYETVVYGWGSCDRARYERLLSLATPMIGRGPGETR